MIMVVEHDHNNYCNKHDDDAGIVMIVMAMMMIKMVVVLMRKTEKMSPLPGILKTQVWEDCETIRKVIVDKTEGAGYNN